MEDKSLINAADVYTYGNPTSPEEMPERPLVTFALFAYNQEQYIREAVEAAFSQDYSPLEIILSDDCSTDGTYAVMRSMAEDYKGPHFIRLRQSEVNLGTALHVYAVSLVARGSLIVVAAGDDISMSSRCSELVFRWKAAGFPSACLHSAASFFVGSPGGSHVSSARSNTISSKLEALSFLRKDRLPFLSPTCAYTIDLFRDYDPLIGGSIIEDGVLSLRSLLAGRLIAIEKPLVSIRRLSQTAGTGYSVAAPTRWNRFLLSRIISTCNEIRDLQHSDVDASTCSELELRYIKKVARLGGFFVPLERSKSHVWRTVFFLRYTLFYPASASLFGRAKTAIAFLGWSENPFIRAGYYFLMRVRR